MEARTTNKRRWQRVRFETDRYWIEGEITLPPEGYQSRFSDAINRPDVGFLPVTNASIAPLDGGVPEQRDFIVLAKAHVRLAYPIDDA